MEDLAPAVLVDIMWVIHMKQKHPTTGCVVQSLNSGGVEGKEISEDCNGQETFCEGGLFLMESSLEPLLRVTLFQGTRLVLHVCICYILSKVEVSIATFLVSFEE